jgi:hypothetical protein
MNLNNAEFECPTIRSYVHKIFIDEVDGTEKLFYGYLTNYNQQDKVYEVK